MCYGSTSLRRMCISGRAILYCMLQVEAGRFERVREGLARKYRNANMRPEQAAGYMRLLVLRATVWHVDAVLAVLDSLTPADVQVRPCSTPCLNLFVDPGAGVDTHCATITANPTH